MVAVPSRGRADAGLQRVAPEAAATQELYERHAARIFAFCLGRLRDREEAEDATQSTFLNAFRGLQRGVELEHEQAWLYKIAENVCLTRQRSRVRRRRVEAPGDLDALQDTLPSPAHDADELLQLPQALQGLTDQQRRALLLREWQGLSYREIAAELGLSQSAVETLLFRARRSLAEGLEEQPKRRGLGARVRAAGDTGSLVALVKTLFFSGGAKVIVAGAVAAGTVVAGTPSVRHAIEHAMLPPAHRVAPMQREPAPTTRPAAPVAARPHTVQQTAPSVVPLSRHGFHDGHAHHARHAAVSHGPAAHEQSPSLAAPGRVKHEERHAVATPADVARGRSTEHARSRPSPAPAPRGHGQAARGRGQVEAPQRQQQHEQPGTGRAQQSQPQGQGGSNGQGHAQQAPTQPSSGQPSPVAQAADGTASDVVHGAAGAVGKALGRSSH